jgi:4a-hydroxytetrahydrobiopterin dehydratase
VLTRGEIAAAVHDHGWRFLLGAVRTAVAVSSPAQGAAVASAAVAAAGPRDGCLRVDLSADRVTLTLQDPATIWIAAAELAAAHRISTAVAGLGLATTPDLEPSAPRPVQLLEIAIDAMDIPAIRPFWRALLGYADEPGAGPTSAIVDPLGQAPAIWFQQMDTPRIQRNRIHFDLCVPHDDAQRRLAAALAAGGVLVSDASAPMFWVVADVEGNEACITTWQGRD